MKIKCYSGTNRTSEPIYSNEISRYGLSEGRLNVSLKGGYPNLNMRYNDVVAIDIEDEATGNLSFSGRFISSNYVVYDDPQTGETMIADNSILFELFS